MSLLCSLIASLMLIVEMIQAQPPVKFHYSVNKRPATFVPVPVIFYDPRTSLGFGILAGTQFFMDTTSVQASNAQLYLTYTLRDQFISKLKHFLYLHADCFLWKGQLAYQNFEEDTYGRGGLVDESFRETIRYTSWLLNQQLLRKVSNHLPIYIGVSYQFERFSNLRLSDYQPEVSNNIRTLLATPFIQRSMLGLGMIFDRRDNQNAAHSGSYIDVQLQLDLPFLGGTQSSTELRFDYRKYIPLSKSMNHILAFRTYGHYAFGNISYMTLPRVGESGTGRGFQEGRYRGEFLTSIEVAYRFPLFLKSNHWILGGLQMNIFASASGLHTANSWSILPAMGIGFRYHLDRDARISARGDIAMGLHANQAIYFNINEAF